MIRRLYIGLCITCLILSVLCVPRIEIRVGAIFLGVLAMCTGGMILLYELRRRDTRFQSIVTWLIRIGNTIFLVWLLTVAVAMGLVISGSHSDADAAQTDCIIILGGGIRDDQPGQSLRARLAVGLDLMQTNPEAQVIVCGGQAADERYSEASVMYRWLAEHGGDTSRITMENTSTTTLENLKNALAICEKNGWNTDDITVVSNEFHLYRVRRLMQKLGLKPCAAAAPSPSLEMRMLFSFREYFSFCKLIVTGEW